jgi:hypothetical protein
MTTIDPEEADGVTQKDIDAVARQISGGPLGLAHHQPFPGARFGHCFENAAQCVAKNGGQVLYGWTFHLRRPEKLPGFPHYIYATHHAVWHAPPDGRLVDVTPYPEEKHRPIQPSGSTLFLVDSSAQPIRTKNQIAPLPLKFFAVGDDPALAEYIEKLNREEQERCAPLSGK